jgi:hypothetical protein
LLVEQNQNKTSTVGPLKEKEKKNQRECNKEKENGVAMDDTDVRGGSRGSYSGTLNITLA